MQSEIKSNFEKSLNEGNFSSSQKDIKEKNFNKFIEQGFPNKRIEGLEIFRFKSNYFNKL